LEGTSGTTLATIVEANTSEDDFLSEEEFSD